MAVVGHTGRDLTSILDPDTVFALRPTYDAAHRMTHHLDRGGYRWDFGYDAFGRLASRQYPSVVVNGVSTRPVALSRSLEMALLPAGSTSLAAPAPRVLSGAVTTTSTDPAGRITTYTFDPRGNVSAILDPSGRLVQMQYNQAGRLSRSITASGDTVGYEYDVTGRDLLRTVDQRTGHTTVMTYTADGRLKSSVDGVSDQTLEYDRIFDQDGNDTGTLGEVVYIRRGSSANFVDYVGGTAGRPSRVYGPGTVIEYTYHPSGYQNLASAREGTDTAAIRHTHDAFGRVVSITDRLGHRTQYEYDRMNRVVRITNALGGVTTYRYGPIHLVGITDARGQAYDFTVNPLGWITARRDPRGLTETLTHDAVGNIVRHINRRGQTTAFVYDNDDRVVSRTADGKVTTYTYSPDGSLRTASNGESTDSVRVFPPSISNLSGGISQLAVTRRNGRRHALQTPMFSHGLRAAVYGVSSVGNDPNRYLGARYAWLTEDQTYRPVAVSSGTDWDGSTIYDFAPRALRITYVDSAGSMRMVLPTGDTILRSAHGVAYSDTAWDRRLAVYAIDDVIGRTVRRATAARDSARWYGYDALGRLTAQADSTISTYQSCAPDAGGLIKCETLESHQFRSQTLFSYDAVGNPASELGVVATGNRLTQFGAYTLEFDVDGNVTRKFRTASPTTFDQRLFWSTTGQLDSVRTITAGSPALVSFGYDGWGRRVRRTSPTGTVRFVYDGEMLVMETDNGGNKLAEYHYLPGSDRPYSMLRGGRMYYFLVDGPGNVVGVVDDGGNLVSEYRYSAWGLLEKAVEGVANPFLFTGRELDRETGLYFHRARYYDPEIRRFVSEDPIGLAGGVNPYVYAANDPVNKSDPSGRCFGFWYHGMWIPLGGVYACILDGIDSADALEGPDDGADGEEEDRTDPWYKEWTDQVKCSIKNCSHTIEDRRSEELFEEQLKRLARDAWDATARSMRNAAVESSAGMIRAFKKTGESFVRTWYGVSESTESIRDGGEIIAESMIRAFRHTTAVIAGVAVVGGTITSVAAGTTVTVTHGAGGSVIISGAQIVSSNVVVYSGDIEIGPDLDRIRHGVKHAHPNDGTIFRNRAHPLTGVQLPTMADASYYTEWVVPTPGVNHAGPQRLVIGKGGEVYWTGDHYASFLRIQ